jgi:hypothetical protein
MVDELLPLPVFVAACVLLNFDFDCVVGLASLGRTIPTLSQVQNVFFLPILFMLCHGALLGVQLLISRAIASSHFWNILEQWHHSFQAPQEAGSVCWCRHGSRQCPAALLGHDC